ncbi:hypothetical protein J1605_010156 [Eschrichtius robustus]|uniref:Uncharacterized protein n=1 Tax=Eschrichtius robustus TaxID=9764 RepID=A0AB34GQU7_ESCRO|nr:hypothetical protein J1605_010156 [Eschrichtius robustus]
MQPTPVLSLGSDLGSPSLSSQPPSAAAGSHEEDPQSPPPLPTEKPIGNTFSTVSGKLGNADRTRNLDEGLSAPDPGPDARRGAPRRALGDAGGGPPVGTAGDRLSEANRGSRGAAVSFRLGGILT